MSNCDSVIVMAVLKSGLYILHWHFVYLFIICVHLYTLQAFEFVLYIYAFNAFLRLVLERVNPRNLK